MNRTSARGSKLIRKSPGASREPGRRSNEFTMSGNAITGTARFGEREGFARAGATLPEVPPPADQPDGHRQQHDGESRQGDDASTRPP